MADKNFKIKNNIIVNDIEIDPSSPSTDQVLKYNGTKFVSANSGVPSGGLEGQILSKLTDSSFDTAWIDNYADQLRVIAKNGTESQINKGVAVMSTGSAGDRIEIAPADADGTVEVKYMLGVTAENIAADAEGYVTLVGPVTGLNTNSYTVGDILYIDPSTPGAFTTVQPSAPNVDLPLAIVLKQNASSGIIFVRMWSQGAKLGELQDVNLANVADGQVLSYNSTTSTWIPATVEGVGGGAKITVSDTPPSSPSVGNIWFESDTANVYIYYDSYWIEIAGEPGPTGPQGIQGPAGNIGPTGPTGATGPGYVDIPISGSEKTGAYTLDISDVGKYIQVGSGGSIVVPTDVFSQGDIVTVVNNTSSTVSIGLNITTAYIAGDTTDYSSVTLLSRGVVSILFISATVCYLVGNVY